MKRPIRFLVIPILSVFLFAGCEHGDTSTTTAPGKETEALTITVASVEESESTSEPSDTEAETETVTSETDEPAESATTEPMTEATLPPETTITPESKPTEPPLPPSEQLTQPVTQPPAEPPTQPKPTEPKPTEPKPTDHVHSWSDWTQTAAPTCAKDGWKTRACAGCGFTETQNIPATGNHSWQETAPTCTQEGAKTCIVCGKKETVPALGHDWVHSDEVGHWEVLITCYCGAQFYSTSEWSAHATLSTDLDYMNEHAGYEAHEIWVVDTPAKDVCSRCGVVR